MRTSSSYTCTAYKHTKDTCTCNYREGGVSELVRDNCFKHLRIQYFDQRPPVLRKCPSISPVTSPLSSSTSLAPTWVAFQLRLLPPFYASYFCFPQVANLACSISNNEEGVKLVRMAATQIDSLCPQVRKTLHSTTSQIIWMLFIHTNRFMQKKTTDDRATNMASWMEGIESH